MRGRLLFGACEPVPFCWFGSPVAFVAATAIAASATQCTAEGRDNPAPSLAASDVSAGLSRRLAGTGRPSVWVWPAQFGQVDARVSLLLLTPYTVGQLSSAALPFTVTCSGRRSMEPPTSAPAIMTANSLLVARLGRPNNAIAATTNSFPATADLLEPAGWARRLACRLEALSSATHPPPRAQDGMPDKRRDRWMNELYTM